MNARSNKITLCEGHIGHNFGDRRRCLEGLQASGHALWWQGQLLRIDKNDKLAVFGDAVVKSYLYKLWYAEAAARLAQSRGVFASVMLCSWRSSKGHILRNLQSLVTLSALLVTTKAQSEKSATQFLEDPEQMNE